MSDLEDRLNRLRRNKEEEYQRLYNEKLEEEQRLHNIRIAQYEKKKADVVEVIYSSYVKAHKTAKVDFKQSIISDVESTVTKNYLSHSWIIELPKSKLFGTVQDSLMALGLYDRKKTQEEIFKLDGYPDFRKQIASLIHALEVNIFNSIVVEISKELSGFQLHMERRFFYEKELTKKQIEEFIGDKPFGVEGEVLNSQRITLYEGVYKYDGIYSKIDSTSLIAGFDRTIIYNNPIKNPRQEMLGLLTNYPEEVKHHKKSIKSYFSKDLNIQSEILVIDQQYIKEIEDDLLSFSQKVNQREKEVEKIEAINDKIRRFYDAYVEFKEYNFPLEKGYINIPLYVVKTVDGDEYIVHGKENSFIVRRIKNPVFGIRKAIDVGTFDIDGLLEYFT